MLYCPSVQLWNIYSVAQSVIREQVFYLLLRESETQVAQTQKKNPCLPVDISW